MSDCGWVGDGGGGGGGVRGGVGWGGEGGGGGGERVTSRAAWELLCQAGRHGCQGYYGGGGAAAAHCQPGPWRDSTRRSHRVGGLLDERVDVGHKGGVEWDAHGRAPQGPPLHVELGLGHRGGALRAGGGADGALVVAAAERGEKGAVKVDAGCMACTWQWTSQAEMHAPAPRHPGKLTHWH